LVIYPSGVQHKRLEKFNFPLPQLVVEKTPISWPELMLMLKEINTTNLKKEGSFFASKSLNKHKKNL
jgi:hypothetical protein